jgi:hypothetical protein
MIFPQIDPIEAIEFHIKAIFIDIISKNAFLLLSNCPPYFYDNVCYRIRFRASVEFICRKTFNL